MKEFLTVGILILFFSGIFSLIWTWAYIRAVNKREDTCCHHKPQHVHSPEKWTGIAYFECPACKERSFKTLVKIESLIDNDVEINYRWLAGHDRIL